MAANVAKPLERKCLGGRRAGLGQATGGGSCGARRVDGKLASRWHAEAEFAQTLAAAPGSPPVREACR